MAISEPIFSLTEVLNDCLIYKNESKEFQLVFDELKRVARIHANKQFYENSVTPTVLVNEAFLKFYKTNTIRPFENRKHFYKIASTIIRNIIVDCARKRVMLPARFDEEVKENEAESGVLASRAHDFQQLIEIDRALAKLEENYEYLAKLIEYRFFFGLKLDDLAKMYDCSVRKVNRDYKSAIELLRKYL